jgi:PPOX class probable F420-dependent enzyme
MNPRSEQVRQRFASARHGYLATADADGRPHVVPVTFALGPGSDVVVIAIDHKPKSTHNLRRLRNIEVNPRVSVLVDQYDDEDWTRLWWARADGTARVLADGADRERALDELVARYPAYQVQRPAGPVIWIDIDVWRGWAYSDR